MKTRMIAGRITAWAMALLAAVAVAAPSVGAGQARAGGRGVVPQGFWALNPARSKSLNPGRQTLWIIKDDGRRLVWVSTLIDDRRRVQVMSYDGEYGGAASPVVGTPITTRIVATGPGSLHNEGTIAGLGNYQEDCRLSPDRRRFRCEGQISGPRGAQSYVDDFDWLGASPATARP